MGVSINYDKMIPIARGSSSSMENAYIQQYLAKIITEGQAEQSRKVKPSKLSIAEKNILSPKRPITQKKVKEKLGLTHGKGLRKSKKRKKRRKTYGKLK